ncbi:HMG box-containing protein [Phaffia rhodozyma]|uniref:HMG box-containing protein n=1 Tax=Phaffia rhodozyma TaxID=264483 RepID=A0A0F7SJB8_PHARH|nr:HMG box-containing protein [Phaffia rhodozyma]
MPPKSTVTKTIQNLANTYVSPMKNQPKRPTNAYNRYIQSYFAAGKDAIVEGTESAKRSLAAAAEGWKQLTETDKQSYKEAFDKDNKVYNDAKATWQKEIEAWSAGLTEADKTAFKEALKQDKSLLPLRKYARTPIAVNAWLVFLQEFRAKNGSDFTGKDKVTELTKAAAKAYRAQKGL